MFKCEICGKEFDSINGLSNHINKSHKNEMTTEEYYLKYIGEKGKCKECGKDMKFVGLRDGYLTFCSVKCRSMNLEIKQKHKKTCLKNSGYGNPMQNPINKEKRKQTCMKKYDVENPMQNKEIQNKHKKTCLKNSGYDNPMQNLINKEKSKQTNIKKTGYGNPMQNPINKEKSKDTCIKKYDVENYSKTKEFPIKSKKHV